MHNRNVLRFGLKIHLRGGRCKLALADFGLAVARAVQLDPGRHLEATERTLLVGPEVAQADLLAGDLDELADRVLVDLGLIDLDGHIELPAVEPRPNDRNRLALLVGPPSHVGDPRGVTFERQEEPLDREERGEDRRVGGADLPFAGFQQPPCLREAGEQVERRQADPTVFAVELGLGLLLARPVGPPGRRRLRSDALEDLVGHRVHQQGRNALERCKHTDHRAPPWIENLLLNVRLNH
jgi:hypothetical protein